MLKSRKLHAMAVFAGTIALMLSVAGAQPSLAGSAFHGVSSTAVASGTRTSSAAVMQHDVNTAQLPVESTAQAAQPTRQMPFLMPSGYATRKAAAAHSSAAPRGSAIGAAPSKSAGTGEYTPSASNGIQGMADSASICGCQPPDQALAASPNYVLQGVNTSFEAWTTSGSVVMGPVSAASFFGVPSPGACDPSPFLSDPRAFYDPEDSRFWVAELQVQGAFGVDSCPEVTRYWIAVSPKGTPVGTWHVYAFDMSAGTTNAADYTQFGFDQQAIYFSGNMFNQAGSAYEYAEIFGAKKSAMEAGSAVTAYGFFQLNVGGTMVDTVQPVESESSKGGGSRGGLFINSYNINFGGGQCASGCSGLVVWTLAKPGTSTDSLSGVTIGSDSYSLPPQADEPGCAGCIETLDTRISGTPVYHDGLISFALETAVNNGSQIVPGILWGQVEPTLNDSGSITSAFVLQQGYYDYSGDGAASFGALMPDNDGNLFMVFEFMNSSSNPGVAYVSRRATYTLGAFHDYGIYLRAGDAATNNSRWGDFEATSFDGPGGDHVWFAGEYSASNGDWSTFIGRDIYVIGTP